MQKIKIEIPDKILFTYQFLITKEDINIANHMGNERVLNMANDIREKMFMHLDCMSILHDTENTQGIVIANHTINYKNEGFLNDEITCQTGITNITECSFDLIFNFIKQDGRTLAVLRSGCVYYNFNLRKIRPLPEDFLDKIK
jgi:acyl-CoA thioesterase FadM